MAVLAFDRLRWPLAAVLSAAALSVALSHPAPKALYAPVLVYAVLGGPMSLAWLTGGAMGLLEAKGLLAAKPDAVFVLAAAGLSAATARWVSRGVLAQRDLAMSDLAALRSRAVSFLPTEGVAEREKIRKALDLEAEIGGFLRSAASATGAKAAHFYAAGNVSLPPEASRCFEGRTVSNAGRLFVPVMLGARALGVIEFDGLDARGGGRLDVFAKECGSILANLIARHRALREAERLTGVYSVLQEELAAFRSIEPGEIAQTLVSSAVRVFPEAHGAAVRGPVDHSFHIKLAASLDALARKARGGVSMSEDGLFAFFPLDKSAAWYLVVSGRPDAARKSMLETLAAHAAAMLALADLHQKIERLALYDALTGVPNRRALLDTLDREAANASRANAALAFFLLDIDHFKRVNDTHGHPVGDEVLKAVAAAVAGAIRAGDSCGRYGGEEFGGVLPATDEPGALAVGDKIRRAIEETNVLTDAGVLRVTASVGIACLGSGEKTEHLVKRCDRALYEAKKGGRNRVEAAAAPVGAGQGYSPHARG